MILPLDKLEAVLQIEKAKMALNTAMLYPRAFAIVDFHDIKAMVGVLTEILESLNQKHE